MGTRIGSGSRKTSSVKRLLTFSASVLALGGCGTIMHGTNQDLGVSSSPTDATVTVDNQEKGRTPLVAKLSRKDNHILRIQLAGYQPFEAAITRKVSGWVWGNIVFGGLIGLAVDAISGGLYVLTPEQITGQLAKQGASVSPKRDGLYVVLVQRAEPSWQQVTNLKQQ